MNYMNILHKNKETCFMHNHAYVGGKENSSIKQGYIKAQTHVYVFIRKACTLHEKTYYIEKHIIYIGKHIN